MPGSRAVQSLQIPYSGTDREGKCPAVARGGGGGGRGAGRSWDWLMHEVFVKIVDSVFEYGSECVVNMA